MLRAAARGACGHHLLVIIAVTHSQDQIPDIVKQSGRKPYLGGGYYHKAEIAMDYITNRSTRRSGDLSFELWAMPYYGATSGVVLMTKGADALGGGGSYTNASPEGYAVLLDRRRFPELNLWEFTRRGWKFRDALSFSRKADL